MKSPIQWTWGSGLRPPIDLHGLSRVVTADYVQSHYSLLLLFRLRLSFFFSSSYLIVESRRPRTWLSISTFGRVSSQYVRSLNKILAHVYEKDWYIPDISCSYKMNTGSIILCLILILSVRFNASLSSLILEFRTILVDVKDMWIWKISIDHFRRSFGNELLEPRANCELGK